MEYEIPFKNVKEKAITLIGEILIDEIRDTNTNKIRISVGGSPANIAMNMKDLGIKKIYLFSAVGKDEYSRIILNKLENNGITTEYINKTDYPTSIVQINKATQTPNPKFYRGADYYISYTDALEQAIIHSSILHFSFWTLTSEPSKSTIYKAIETAKKYNTLIGFDPNYHKDLTTGLEIDFLKIKKIMRMCNIMKPSLDDSKRLFGDNVEYKELLRIYKNTGCDLVVLTEGKNGLSCINKNKVLHYSSLATKVVDVTGAGDAFYSGMYTAILNNDSIEDIIKIGSLCSAYNLRSIGGRVKLPHYDKLKDRV